MAPTNVLAGVRVPGKRRPEHPARPDRRRSRRTHPPRVGAFASAIRGLVAPALATLRAEFPRLEVAVRESEAPESLTALTAGDLDLVITVDYRHGPPRTDGRYYRMDLLADVFDAVLSPVHPLASAPRLALRDLAEQPWVVDAGTGPCGEVTRAACAAAGFTPDVAHFVADRSAAFALVAAGGGVTLVPRLGAPNPAGVTIRPLADPPVRHVYAAVRAGSEGAATIAPTLAALRRAAST